MSFSPPSKDATSNDNGRHGVVAVIQEKQKFLVIRRSALVRAPGLLCFPGGGIETGEDFETAMRRELMEELSLEVVIDGHLWHSVTRWGTKLEWMKCRRIGGKEPVPEPAEVAEVLWLTQSELMRRTDLLGSIPDFFEALSQSRFQL